MAIGTQQRGEEEARSLVKVTTRGGGAKEGCSDAGEEVLVGEVKTLLKSVVAHDSSLLGRENNAAGTVDDLIRTGPWQRGKRGKENARGGSYQEAWPSATLEGEGARK